MAAMHSHCELIDTAFHFQDVGFALMKKRSFKSKKSSIALFVAGTLSAPFGVAAEQQVVEEVIVTGSRGAPRSVFDSVAPIDVISSDTLANQGDTDLSNIIRNVVPSYNVNTQPISDAATIVRPANLRGLAPDHTLVLVNGKRRHRAAVIYWLGNGVADGAQGPDISPIPAIALKQLEVLRDGAAAQYGTDAIAGVMNFLLKDTDEGGSFEFKTGQFYEGDGTLYTLAGNIGVALPYDGFLNASIEYGNSDATDRSIQRGDAQALIDAGNTAVANPAQIWGQPEIKDDLKTIFNAAISVSDVSEAYAFGNFASKEVDGGFYFRNPDTRSGVFGATIDDPSSDDEGDRIPVRLVADLTPDQSGNCPSDLTLGDAAGLQAVIDDPNCFVFNELFPGGFTPRFGGEATDTALTLGLRSKEGESWSWDVSYSYGESDVDFFIRNTVNASLGPRTPTEFNPGAYTQTDQAFNVGVSKAYEVGFASELNVAAGAEWREEKFEITVGDEASYEIGPLAAQGFSAASNGFPGFSPLAGGDWSRSNIAAYLDLEANVTDPWLVGVAFRWEDYEDFGTTFNGKIATNYQLTDVVSLRGSFNTGFRAPTPGQSNAFNVSTEFDPGANELVNNGTIPSTNPVAQLRGGIPLDAETSINLSAGVVFQLSAFNITVDYFNIQLEDRIAVSQEFELEQSEIDELLASGITSAANLQNFRFFTNDFDTTTSGIDVVATTSADMLGGVTEYSLAFNYTSTEVDSFTPEIIDETRIRELEEGLPQTRWNIAANHSNGKWRFLGRLNYFDEFFDSEDDYTYDAVFTVDAEASYSITDSLSVILGAQNLLDEFPEETPLDIALGKGNRYSQFAPSGFGGGFYYTRLKYDF